MWKVNKRHKKFTRESLVESLSHTYNTWLPPANKSVRENNVFTDICLSTNRWVSLVQCAFQRGAGYPEEGGGCPGDGYSLPRVGMSMGWVLTSRIHWTWILSARDVRPLPRGPNSFNVMHLLGKFSKIVCWRPR